jgi:hypothetical protein
VDAAGAGRVVEAAPGRVVEVGAGDVAGTAVVEGEEVAAGAEALSAGSRPQPARARASRAAAHRTEVLVTDL